MYQVAAIHLGGASKEDTGDYLPIETILALGGKPKRLPSEDDKSIFDTTHSEQGP